VPSTEFFYLNRRIMTFHGGDPRVELQFEIRR